MSLRHKVTMSLNLELMFTCLNTGINIHNFTASLLRALKSLKIFKQIYLSEITYLIFKFKKTKATCFDAKLKQSFKLPTKVMPH